MKGFLAAIARDNGYLAEQLQIEGISCSVESTLTRDVAQGHAVLIIGNTSLSAGEIEVLTHFLAEGGKVLVTAPSAWVFRAFQLVSGSQWDYSIRELGKHLIQLCGGITNPHEELIIRKKIGKGELRVLLFDVSESIFFLTHGTDVVEDRDGDGSLRVDDGITVEKEHAQYPQADIIREWMVQQVRELTEVPIPRWGWFPNAYPAGIIFSHDSDDAQLDHILALREREEKEGIPVTIFIRPQEAAVFRKAGSVPHSDWQLHPTYLRLPGLPKFLRKVAFSLLNTRIVKRIQRKRLFSQRKRMNALFPVSGVRNHGLLWNKREDQPVWMSEAGIAFDSTLGANYAAGYFHGTGKPFFLRHPNGKRNLDVLEIPSHLMEAALIKEQDLHGKNKGADFEQYFSRFKEYTHTFLDECVSRFHSLAVISFHYPYLFVNPGKEQVMDWYIDTIRYAKEKGMHIASMSFWNDFWRKRAHATIHWKSWDAVQGILSCTMVPGEACEGLTACFPGKLADKKLGRVEIDGEEVNIEWHGDEGWVVINSLPFPRPVLAYYQPASGKGSSASRGRG